MLKKFTTITAILFSVVWAIIIFTEYWHYNPNYAKALSFFQYADLLGLFVLLGGVASVAWSVAKKKQHKIKFVNGLSIFGCFLLLDILTISFFSGEVGIKLNAPGLLAHLGHVIGVSFCVYLIYLVCRVMGSLLTLVFPLKITPKDLPIIQTAIGIMALTALLFVLGIFQVLYIFIIAPLLLAFLLLNWRRTYQLIKGTLFQPIDIAPKFNAIGLFSFLFLAVFLVIDFVQILRPFPLGSDSINVYVNIPTLIAEYAGLVDGFQAYNWSLFMSLGLVTFGRVDVVLALSFFGGVLTLFALFRLARKWLNVNYALLCLLLFFSAPMINFLSFMDMKIDLGLLYFLLCILLLFVNWLRPLSLTPSGENPVKSARVKKNKKGIKQKKVVSKSLKSSKLLLQSKAFFIKYLPPFLIENRMLVLMGLFAGFAFGIKMTTLLVFFALLAGLWYKEGGIKLFLTAVLLIIGAVFLFRLDDQSLLRQYHQNVSLIQWLLLGTGLGLGIYVGLKNKDSFFQLLKKSSILAVFFILPVLPWMLKHTIEAKEISTYSLLNGKKAIPKIDINTFAGGTSSQQKEGAVIIPGLYQMPEPYIQGPKKKSNTRSGVREDLHKFMGYESLPERYLSLPFDVFINNNLNYIFTDTGFLLLLLFPILFLLAYKNDPNEKISHRALLNLALIVLCTLLVIISVPSAYLNKHNLETTQEGIALLEASTNTGILEQTNRSIKKSLFQLYEPIHQFTASFNGSKDAITYPILILLFLALILLINFRIQPHSKTTKTLILFLSFYFFLWWLLGSGAAWYGILFFCVPYMFMLKGISLSGDHEWTFLNVKQIKAAHLKSSVLILICVIWIFMAFVFRSTNYNPVSETFAKHIYIPPIIQYQIGQIDERALLNAHMSSYDEVRTMVNKEDESLVYLVGTLLNYFVKKNDRRVFNDTYLGFFDQMVNRFQSKERITQVLKDAGFKYIILDLNMATNDFTPERSLTRKVTQLLNALYNNPGVELVVTDRTIQSSNTGQVNYGVFQDQGTIVNKGTIALFRIK